MNLKLFFFIKASKYIDLFLSILKNVLNFDLLYFSFHSIKLFSDVLCQFPIRHQSIKWKGSFWLIVSEVQSMNKGPCGVRQHGGNSWQLKAAHLIAEGKERRHYTLHEDTPTTKRPSTRFYLLKFPFPPKNTTLGLFNTWAFVEHVRSTLQYFS